MGTIQHQSIADAWVESTSSWHWQLKVDCNGLFRWYLNGVIETQLRGCTREHAEMALRRFVEHALQGELQITYLTERISADSELKRADSKSATA